MTRTGPGLRAARAMVFAALCVAMSTTTHVMLSRAPVPLPVVAGVAAAVFSVAYLLGGRERRFGPIAAALIPQELAADTVFNSGQRTCYGPDGGPVTGSWQSLHQAIICHGDPVGTSLAERSTPITTHGLSVSPWLLLAAHILVSLIAACLLRCGEAGLHRLLRTAFEPLTLAMTAFTGGSRVLRDVPVHQWRRPRAASPFPSLPLLLHSVVRRGPPCPAAA